MLITDRVGFYFSQNIPTGKYWKQSLLVNISVEDVKVLTKCVKVAI